MSHQPMHINNWVEVSQDLEWYIEEKTRVIREKGMFPLRLSTSKVVILMLPHYDKAKMRLILYPRTMKLVAS